MADWDPFADPADDVIPQAPTPKAPVKREKVEKRLNPDDGKEYTFWEFLEAYKGHFPDEDINKYWNDAMRVETSEQMAIRLSNEIGAKQQDERQRTASQLFKDAPSEESPFFDVGDFVELLLCEGPSAGSWVACQILELGTSPDKYNCFLPAQIPLVSSDAFVPNIPVTILRKALSPANEEVLREYYPVPRVEKPPLSEKAVEHGWYPGKPAVKGRKLRVAVLHGTSSNERIMKQQISRLRTTCSDRVEFIFLEGGIDASTIPENPQYALMSKVFPGQQLFQFTYYAQGNNADYGNLDEVLGTLQEQLRSHGPIDGVLGTGQGSNICTLLAAQAACGVGVPLSFAIHFGGTWPTWTWRFPNLFGAPLRIPSFHTIGTEDPFLHGNPCFAPLYTHPTIKLHTGDHRPIPRDVKEAGELCAEILRFIEESAAAEEGDMPVNAALVGA